MINFPFSKLSNGGRFFFSIESYISDQDRTFSSSRSDMDRNRAAMEILLYFIAAGAGGLAAAAPARHLPAIYEAPIYKAPIYEPPVYKAPNYQAPTYRAPHYENPSYLAPHYQPAVYRAPHYEPAAYKAPDYEPPRYGASGYPPGVYSHGLAYAPLPGVADLLHRAPESHPLAHRIFHRSETSSTGSVDAESADPPKTDADQTATPEPTTPQPSAATEEAEAASSSRSAQEMALEWTTPPDPLQPHFQTWKHKKLYKIIKKRRLN